jgi:hypothetical protein
MRKILEIEVRGVDDFVYYKEGDRIPLSDAGLGMLINYSCEKEHIKNPEGRIILFAMSERKYTDYIERENDGK